MPPQPYLEPLRGKYYGTVIRTACGHMIEVWLADPTNTPSQRQLEAWDFDTMEDFRSSEYYADLVCDGHYENANSYRVAKKIVAALQDDQP